MAGAAASAAKGFQKAERTARSCSEAIEGGGCWATVGRRGEEEATTRVLKLEAMADSSSSSSNFAFSLWWECELSPSYQCDTYNVNFMMFFGKKEKLLVFF